MWFVQGGRKQILAGSNGEDGGDINRAFTTQGVWEGGSLGT